MNLITRNHFVAQSLWRLMFRDLPTRTALLSLSLFAGLVLFGLPLFGQGNSGNATPRVPLPEDWTDHQVVFSKPATAEKAAQGNQDPRYLNQVNRRSVAGSRNPNETDPAGA